MKNLHKLYFLGSIVLLLVFATASAQSFIRDTHFNGNNKTANSQVRCIEPIAEGPYKDKIMVAGIFLTYNNQWGPNYPSVVRLNSDGTLDPSFKASLFTGSETIYAIAVQPDGKVVVGGAFTLTAGSRTFRNLVRLNANGSLDATFNPSGGGFWGDNSSANEVKDLILNPGSDGRLKIWVGGLGEIYNGQRIVSGTAGQKKGGLVILNSEDGSVYAKPLVENAPGTSAGGVFSLYRCRDGRVLIGGEFGAIGGSGTSPYIYARRVASLLPNGRLDPLFRQVADASGGPSSTVYSVAEQILPDNSSKIIIAGPFTAFKDNIPGGTLTHYSNLGHIARLNTNGTLDPSFSSQVTSGFNSGTILSILPDGQGRLLVGGAFTSYNGLPANRMVRLQPDGALDASFDIGTGFESGPSVTTPYVEDLAFQPGVLGSKGTLGPEGALLAAGNFAGFNTSGQQGFFVRLLDVVVLPEYITGFNVKKQGAQAHISFTGLQAHTVYRLERSIDGRSYQLLATFSTGSIQQVFTYQDPLPIGKTYYRVTATNPASGGKQTSPVISLIYTGHFTTQLLRLSPGELKVVLNSDHLAKEEISLVIVSLGGQLLYKECLQLRGKHLEKRISITPGMKNGIITLTSSAEQKPLKSLMLY